MKTLLENRQARHQYHIEADYLAGLKLEGWEVKAILAGQANFNGGAAYIQLENGEAWVVGMTITPTKQALRSLFLEMDPARKRKLLLNRSELNKLTKKVAQQGYTLVPLEIQHARKLKLKIGLAKGKKAHDKRETLKERDVTRQLQRDMAAA